jgi:hypothetical protein
MSTSPNFLKFPEKFKLFPAVFADLGFEGNWALLPSQYQPLPPRWCKEPKESKTCVSIDRCLLARQSCESVQVNRPRTGSALLSPCAFRCCTRTPIRYSGGNLKRSS